MNSFLTKKIIALLLAIMAVLAVFLYTQLSIKSQIKPTRVVLAKQDIPPDTKITKDMVTYVKIPGDAVPKNEKIVKNGKEVVGYFTAPGYGISKSSMINASKIVAPNKRRDNAIQELEPSEQTFSFKADIPITHGNAILPGQTIDLYTAFMYMDEKTRQSKPFFGRVEKHVKVLTVRDAQGLDVYSDKQFTRLADPKEEETRQKKSSKPLRPALITVAVDIDSLQFLSKARMIGAIVPIATGLSKPDVDVQKEIQDGELNLTALTSGEYVHDVSITRGLIEEISFDPTTKVKEIKDIEAPTVNLDDVKKEYEEQLKAKTEDKK